MCVTLFSGQWIYITNFGGAKVPLQRYRENLQKMLVAILSHTSSFHLTRVLLVTPPPIDVAMLREYGPRNGIDRSSNAPVEYAAAVKCLGKEFCTVDSRVEVLDFHKAMMDNCSNGKANATENISLSGYLSDGLHLTSKVGIHW
jgi:hypothetical protein